MSIWESNFASDADTIRLWIERVVAKLTIVALAANLAALIFLALFLTNDFDLFPLSNSELFAALPIP